jgi:preprotein translocase subunit SecA
MKPAALAGIVAQVNGLEASVRALDDTALRAAASRLRSRAHDDTRIDELAPEAFALVREAARRAIGERLYDVQIMAAAVLARGHVAEMETGEGKTLAAVAPVFLNALGGRGVHVLTFNDYLARRDAAWMKPIYERLGLTVGCVQEGTGTEERRSAYLADLTYLTAKEAGFDLLRDQLSLDPDRQVQRPFQMALVDEADSILIDEARIPLVIAGAVERPDPELGRFAEIVRRLASGVDYDTDEHGRNIFLTEDGAHRVEALVGCGNLFSSDNAQLLAQVRNALHAEVLLTRDVDYIVRGGAIELVDEFTGRVADNRQWPDGLQAAVEAKEGLFLRDEGRILGSITLQHFLGLYPRLAGMTGTARAAIDELWEFYGLEVTRIPTHRPSRRVDRPDVVFTTREAKYRAVAEEVEAVHASGRPVLVGTVSVAESEQLAAQLRLAGIDCHVLNAKNDQEEAAIVARAGQLGAVTISTNMAGRGTDIELGSDAESRARVVELGGLYVLGTNRHESRRIDDQLRGRAGRQGDPGESRFFLSLEDDLIARYGIADLVPRRILPHDHDGSIDHPLVRREIARAQRFVEGQTFDIRRRLWDYSSLIEKQRQVVVDWRQHVLDGTADLDLLAQRAGDRYLELETRFGAPLLETIERRLTLVILDRCWSEHLGELERLRDEMQLVSFDGRTPLVEFCRIAGGTFDRFLERVDEEIVATFHRIRVTEAGVDWEAEHLTGPSATWTYLVNDNVFGSNVLLQLSLRPTIFLGAIALWPALFVWGLYHHWLRRKRRKAEVEARHDRLN